MRTRQQVEEQVRTQYCGRCENGWLFREDPEEYPHMRGTNGARQLASPCTCNGPGQAAVAQYRQELEGQEWYRSFMASEADRKARKANPEVALVFEDSQGIEAHKQLIRERLDRAGSHQASYLAEVASYRENGSRLTPDQEARSNA